MSPTTRLPVGASVVVGLVSLVAVVDHLAQPTGPVGDTTYLLLIVGAAGLAVAGAAASGGVARSVAWFVAAGLVLNAVGDVVWDVYQWTGHSPDVSLADVPYLAAYVGLIGAVWLALVQGSWRSRVEVEAVVDVATVVVVSLLVFWNLSIDAIVGDTTVSSLTKVVWSAYPLMDAVLLALVLRALVARRSRDLLGAWFAVGVTCWLATDTAYLLLEGTRLVNALTDVGWMSGAVLMSLAGWHRSSTAASTPETPESLEAPETPEAPARTAGRDKLLIAVVPLLIPPAFALLDTLRGHPVRAWPLFVGTAALVALAFVRTARLLRSEAVARVEADAARDAAVEASRAKSAFLATMSHEIRTPMNGVIGLTSLLLGSELDARQRQYAEGVRNAGDSLLLIINDILDFSKVEAGHLELEEIDFNLVGVVEEAAQVLAETAQAKDLELLAYCSPELPLSVRGDPARLRQILINLVSNAVKFTEHGEVVLRAQLEDRAEGGIVVRFEVSDTGLGIAPQVQTQLFEAFTQADSSTTRRFGGTGLGLAICRQLVTAMGGSIAVRSEVGHGSTFTATIPLRHAHEPAPAPPSQLDDLTGLRVLIVDDNDTNRLILTEQLGAWGLLPHAVADAGAALRELAGTHYDLAVLDLCMPDVDGLDLARAVSADPALVAPAMVLLTSGPDVSPHDAAAAGLASQLTKPVRLDRLRESLRTAVDGSRSAPPAPVVEVAPSTARLGHVLVVEDGEVNQLVAEGILDHLGYQVTIVDDGPTALRLLDETRFDAVLMDVQMPGMDGLEATGEVRRLEGVASPPRRTPIIAMTASAVDGDRERCLAAGMDDYVSKPISTAAVREALARWVQSADVGSAQPD